MSSVTTLLAASGCTPETSIAGLTPDQVLELCATEGLKPESVHQTRLRVGEGLVGRIAESAERLREGVV